MDLLLFHLLVYHFRKQTNAFSQITIMFEDKFPPGFDFKRRGVVIDESVSNQTPNYDELTMLAAAIVDTRERYRPITNYDISGRSSRGLFIGIPDSGMEAFAFLHTNGFCEIAMSTFDSERRSTISRNCYLWGCESKMNLTSLSLVDALSRWYSTHSVMTPLYLDLLCSNSSLRVSVDHGISIQVDNVDLKDILSKAFDVGAPFIVLRVDKSDESLLRSFNFDLQLFDVNSSINPDVFSFSFSPRSTST